MRHVVELTFEYEVLLESRRKVRIGVQFMLSKVALYIYRYLIRNYLPNLNRGYTIGRGFKGNILLVALILYVSNQ